MKTKTRGCAYGVASILERELVMLNAINILFSNKILIQGIKHSDSITINVYKLVTDLEYEIQYGRLKTIRTFYDKDAICCDDLLQSVYDVAKLQDWFQYELDFLIFEGDCKYLIKEYTLPNTWKD